MSVVSLEGHRLISSWNYQVSPVLTDDVSLFKFCRERLRNAGTGIKMSNARGGGGGGGGGGGVFVLLIHPCLFLFAVLATGAVVTAF